MRLKGGGLVVLKEYRKKRKFTLEQFADEMDVSVSTIKRWENKTYAPTLIEAISICKKLRLPFNKLLKEYKEE